MREPTRELSGAEGKRRRGVGEKSRVGEKEREREASFGGCAGRSFLPSFNPFRGFAVAENNRRYITGNVINPQNFAPLKGLERARCARCWLPFARGLLRCSTGHGRLTTPDEVRPGTQTFAYCRNETTTRPLNARLPANFTYLAASNARMHGGRGLDAINNSSVQRAPSKRKFATTDSEGAEGCVWPVASGGVVSLE